VLQAKSKTPESVHAAKSKSRQFDEGGFLLTFVDPGTPVLRGSTRHLIGGALLVWLMLLLPLMALAAPGEPEATGDLAAPSQMKGTAG